MCVAMQDLTPCSLPHRASVVLANGAGETVDAPRACAATASDRVSGDRQPARGGCAQRPTACKQNNYRENKKNA